MPRLFWVVAQSSGARGSIPARPRDRRRRPPRAAPSRSPARRGLRAHCLDSSGSWPNRAARARESIRLTRCDKVRCFRQTVRSLFKYRLCFHNESEVGTQTEVHGRLLSSRIVVPAFAATLFISAGLMFLVEPMVAKMVLPRLGGSSAVWSTCLVFFQATLLLGYGYAHALTRLLPRSTQILVHAAVLLLAALALPLDLGAGAPLPGEPPSLWLLIRLVLVAGPPVVRHLGDRAAAAKLVRVARPRGRWRSVFPVCRQQRRQPAGAACLSAAGGAGAAARPAGVAVVLRLRRSGARNCAVRRRDPVWRAARYRGLAA
jgi:hypothetical protein